MIFLTSDTHWSHSNILGYCNRPFSDVHEMNKALTENWNSRVGKDDLVFHLGDFAFCRGWSLNNIITGLNGTIVLIKGNHDTTKHLVEEGIKHIYYEAYLVYKGVRFHLNHYPPGPDYKGIERRPKSRLKTNIVLHGHSHSQPGKRSKIFNHIPCIDVGVDAWNYQPITFDEILEIF